MGKIIVAKRAARLGLLAAALAGGIGCAGTQAVRTPWYSLEVAPNWTVKATAQQPGQATLIVVEEYGDTAMGEGAGAGASAGYLEGRKADVEVRIYAWQDGATVEDAAAEALRLARADADGGLAGAGRIGDNPPECGWFPRKYTLLGAERAAIDLASRPGHRFVVVGAASGSSLIGAVGRVESEQDPQRYCVNLKHLQTQLQHVLEALRPGTGAGPAAPAAQSSPAPVAEPAPAAAPAVEGSP